LIDRPETGIQAASIKRRFLSNDDRGIAFQQVLPFITLLRLGKLIRTLFGDEMNNPAPSLAGARTPAILIKATNAQQVSSSVVPASAETEISATKKVKSVPVVEAATPKLSKILSAPSALLLARSAKRDYSAPTGKRLQTLYPLERPKSKFLRVHPSREYRQMGVLTYRDEDAGDVYYISPELEIPETWGIQIKVTDLYAGVTHDGTFFVWPVNRSESSWYRSARRAVLQCTTQWLKVVSRKGPNIYDLYTSEFPIPEPDWSSLPAFADMLELAFDGHMIESLDHPAFLKARGKLDDEE
jgi:hypothetical protein